MPLELNLLSRRTSSIDIYRIRYEDVFYYPGVDSQHRLRRSIALQREPLAEFMCNQCPDLGTRLFAMRDLKPHLYDKYVLVEHVLQLEH